MNLYEICAELRALENAAEDDMYIDPETGELIDMETALERLTISKENKIENIALWVRNLAADVTAIDSEIKRLQSRKRTAETKAERLKGYLISSLTREDGTTEKVKTPRVSVSVRNNKPSLFCDEAILPKEFLVASISYRADKDQIREVLSRGIDVPGAHMQQSRSVIIR